MGKQVAVFGLGRFGSNLAEILYNAGYEVLAVDKSADLVEAVGSHVTSAIKADATHEAALQKLGINKFDVAVVAMGTSIQDSVMITIQLKKMGIRYIVARADNEIHGAILESIGADKVLYPERDTALRTGPVLTLKGVVDYIPLEKSSGIIKVKATPYFIGKTLADIGFGSSSVKGAAVLMIQRGKEGIVNPSIEEVVSHIDILIIAGNISDVDVLLEQADKHSENGEKKS
ncbi:MAG: TrkA family potassium uptake protein [Dehalococcoidales bacterium]|nr:TrkA family potassium uptake protein [Dehalococcoidales bacterium]